jgi:hypothetical protein
MNLLKSFERIYSPLNAGSLDSFSQTNQQGS